MFRNVSIQNSDGGELPRRRNTTFTTRRKFEFKWHVNYTASSNVRNRGVKVFITEKFSLSVQWEELANKEPGKRFCSDGTGISKLRSSHSSLELPAIYCFDKGGIECSVGSGRGEGGPFCWNSCKENSIWSGFLGIFRSSPHPTLISAILTSYLEWRSKLQMSEKKMVTKLWIRKYRQVNGQLADQGYRVA